MINRKTALAIVLTIASAAVSMAFVAYGAGLVMADGMEGWLVALGVTISVYGLGGAMSVAIAWRTGGPKTKRLFGFFAIGFMVVSTIGMLDVGTISGQEMAMLLVILSMVLVNYSAVHVVENLREAV